MPSRAVTQADPDARLIAGDLNRPYCLRTTGRRILCALAALLLAGNAQAAWVQLGRSDIFRIYLDERLIQRNGDFAQIWELMDFTVAQWADAQTAVWSIKNLLEYDCTQPRFRTLAAEAYTEQMGEGRLVASERLPDPKWESTDPGSAADKVRQVACGKK